LKKQLETSEIQNGACIYCGQLMPFETTGLAREDDLNEWATEKCDCSEAKIYAKRKKSLSGAKEKIKQFFGSESSGEIVIKLLDMATDAIFENKIDDLSINIGNGCKGKVSQNSKGNIKVERTDTRKVKYEQS
jgi:hypothetical protein